VLRVGLNCLLISFPTVIIQQGFDFQQGKVKRTCRVQQQWRVWGKIIKILPPEQVCGDFQNFPLETIAPRESTLSLYDESQTSLH